MSAFNPCTLHTVFLDRDGTINVKANDGAYIRSPTELVLLPGAAKGIAMLNAVRMRTILVTNQRWLSEPFSEPAHYAAVHARLEELLKQEGAWLDAAYHCPHTPGVCDCRKPGAGMLLRAAREHNFDLAGAVIIGDSDSDMLAGQTAGTATIRLGANGRAPIGADAAAKDLGSAVRRIIRARSNTSDAP
jgi:D-glycero-D-manno-heptose 1,7-bisphosphate phosphatase